MGGLLIKDFYVLKKMLKQYAILSIFFLLMGIYIGSFSYFQAMLTVSLVMVAMTSATYDSMAGWDEYVLTMPVGRSTIVLSKYALTLVLSVAALFFGSIVACAGGYFVPSLREDVSETIRFSAAIGIAVLFIYSLLWPVIFKLGVERSRMFMFAFIAIPIICMSMLERIMPQEIRYYFNSHFSMLLICAAVLGFLCYGLSYMVSRSIFNKKEF